MRKLWPLAAALAFGMAGPLPAQFSVTGAQVTNAPGTNASGSMVPSISMTQMLPKMNMGNALSNPFGGTKSFNFARMLPTFSLRNGLWPIRTPPSQQPNFATSTGQKK